MFHLCSNPTNIYLFKVSNRNTRKWCEICSKLTLKTSELRDFTVFIVNFEHILHLFLVFLVFSTVEFEHVNVSWGINDKDTRKTSIDIILVS